MSSKKTKIRNDDGQYRDWMFTINNYTERDIAELAALYESDNNLIYLCAGKEVCPTTGTPHLQCYAQWTNVKCRGQRFSYIRSRLTRAADISKMYSTREACRKYTLKEGDAIIHGTFEPSKQGQNRGEAAKSMLIEGKPMVEVATEHFGLYLRYHRGLEKFEKLVRCRKRSWKTEVIFMYGPTGCGKSRLAHKLFPGICEMEFQNGFWSPYSGEEAVLWDDWHPSMISEHLFLRLTDRYPMPIRQIGGWAQWCPRTIVITTNEHVSCLTPRMSRRIEKVFAWDDITGEGPIITPSPLVQKIHSSTESEPDSTGSSQSTIDGCYFSN